MSKQTHLFESINNLKNIRAIISDDETLAVAAHCLDMAILEISQVADTKVMKNERMMLEYLELNEKDYNPGLWCDTPAVNSENLKVK